MQFSQCLSTMFVAKTEVITELLTVVITNTSHNNHLADTSDWNYCSMANQKTFSGQCAHLFGPIKKSHLLLQKHLSCAYMLAVYLYTHISQGIWSMKSTDRCTLKEGSTETAQMAQYSAPADTSFSLFLFITQCQDSRGQDPKRGALCVRWKTYLKVVRWQQNDETLGTAAQHHSRDCQEHVCWHTHLKTNRQATRAGQNGTQQNTR